MSWTSLYIHVPFCRQRCGYCDFNTYAGLQHLIPGYIHSLCQEIKFIARSAESPLSIHTIFFGGGTPSLLTEAELEIVLNTVRHEFTLKDPVEITLEANPGTVTDRYLHSISALGVNRISLGMQTADQSELAMLERQHSYQDVVQAVQWSYSAGIHNINLDLIYGLPGQSLQTWLKSVEAAIVLQTQHLSLYALTLEHGTRLLDQVEQGALPEPDPDLAADMYEAASELLEEAGFEQYEISNWARRDHSGELSACQHNLQYWRNLPYLGLGAGAHGFIEHCRTVDEYRPTAYIKKMSQTNTQNSELKFPRTPATVECHPIDVDNEIGETMMMGLRLVREGVSNQAFYQRFGMNLVERFDTQIKQLISYGLLEWAGELNDRLRLTKKGYLLGNQVFKEFI
jgi:oxygen-independent coproporphyrinogen-3 oxidase